MSKKPVQYHEGSFPPKRLAWERILLLIGPTGTLKI